MNENQYDLLRQQDQNLREALRQEATELPPMPDDLNDRVLQRIGAQQKRPAKVRRLWPWIAAACVAAVMVVWLMPPKTSPPASLAKDRGVVTPNTQKVEEPVICDGASGNNYCSAYSETGKGEEGQEADSAGRTRHPSHSARGHRTDRRP